MLFVVLFILVVLWSALPYSLSKRPQCGYWHQDSWSSYKYRCMRPNKHSGEHRSAMSRMKARGSVIWLPPA